MLRGPARQLVGILVASVVLLLALALAAVSSAQAAPAPDACAARPAGTAESGSLQGGRGAQCLRGGPGRDVLAGGPGGDALLGGPGDDQILPGSGVDRVSAGPGDDLVFARDGKAETVGCGPGRDVVSADEDDVLRGCEEVSLAAPEISWIWFDMHANAYGYSAVGHRSDGYCRGDKNNATCKGTSEQGVFPFSGGREVLMDWNTSAYGGSEIVMLKAPQTDSILVGRTDPGWSGAGLQITAAWVGQWIDPNHGVIRTGVGGAPETQGGPLRAYLSYHSFPGSLFTPPRESGYSLDLRGWLKFVFIA